MQGQFKDDDTSQLNSEALTLTDELLATDPLIQQLNDKIASWQRRLKNDVSAAQYQLYLEIEEVVNERLLALAERTWSAGLRRGQALHETVSSECLTPRR